MPSIRMDSRQDPYCVISVGGQTFRTRTAVDGGRNPVWNETFRFDVGHAPDTGGTAEVVEVVVKADQLVEHDATLGSASIPLATARQTAGTDCYHTRAAIVSPQHHRVHGAVSLALRWDPASSSCSGSGSGEQVPAAALAVRGLTKRFGDVLGCLELRGYMGGSGEGCGEQGYEC
eukprot:XP_001698830.1 predicted protein [Chlamydomonas reinhardtii]